MRPINMKYLIKKNCNFNSDMNYDILFAYIIGGETIYHSKLEIGHFCIYSDLPKHHVNK